MLVKITRSNPGYVGEYAQHRRQKSKQTPMINAPEKMGEMKIDELNEIEQAGPRNNP